MKSRRRKKRDGLVQTRLEHFILRFPNLKQLPSTMGFLSPDQGPLGGHIESETEAGKFKRMRDSVEGPEPSKRLKRCETEVPNEPNLI